MDIVELMPDDLDEAIALMHEVYDEMPDQAWFAMDSDEELRDFMVNGGFALKAVADGMMAGIFVAKYVFSPGENLGEYLNLAEEEMAKVAHMDICMVRKDYRGRRIQKQLMTAAEKRLADLGYHYLMGTVHPDNIYSGNIFKKLGYRVVMQTEKYGGLPRNIMCKEIV